MRVAEKTLLDELRQSSLYPKFYWYDAQNSQQIVALGKSKDPNDFTVHFMPFDHQNPLSFSPEVLHIDNTSVDLQKPSLNIEIKERTDTPSRDQWNEDISQLLSYFETTDLDKVVMARKTTLTLNQKIDSVDLLERLISKKSGRFYFLIELDQNSTFIGSSPELLFHRKGAQLQTEALAGTIGRDQLQEKDLELAKNLRQGEKEQREFGYVTHFIEQKLRSFASKVNREECRVIQMPYIHHLYQPYTAELTAPIAHHILLQTLHPTPAISGSPQEAAIDYIKNNERFDRSMYAGAIGWTQSDEAHYAVAIRSAIIRQNAIDLFAGAGIVAGSDSTSEWNELELKLTPYLEEFL